MFVGTNYNNYNYYNTLFGLGSSKNSSGLSGLGGSNSNLSDLFSSILNTGKSGNSAVNSSALQFVRDLKSGAGGLKSALTALSSQAFNRTAVSSKPENMTLETSKYSYSAAPVTGTRIKIDQIATGQKNAGAALSASENASVSGTQTFEVAIDGKKHQFSINLSAIDTNKTLQQKMADAINTKGIGVTAAVSTGEDGKSTLSLSAVSTGDNAKSRFEIRDLGGSAVAKTGVSAVTEEAKNALYSINGGPQKSSSTNTVELGGGVKATLKKASEEEVSVTMGVNSETVAGRLSDMVDNYNRMLSAVAENSNDAKGYRLFSRLLGVSTTYMKSLDKVGISFDGDGYMQVNKEQVAEAAENGELEKFFTENRNANYGFTARLSRIAEDVSRNTASYVDKSIFSSDGGYDFGSYGKLQSSRNLLSAGMLFDLML